MTLSVLDGCTPEGMKTIIEGHHIGTCESSHEEGLQILHRSRLQPEHLFEVLRSPSALPFLQLLPTIRQWRDRGEGGIVRFTGPMRGGKTLFALSVAFSLFQDRRVLFAKSDADARDPGQIRSASGLSSGTNGNGNFEFTSFGNADSIRAQYEDMLNADLLVLDEVLFCGPEEITLLTEITRRRLQTGRITIVSSLDKDFRRQPMVGYAEFAAIGNSQNNIELVCMARCECSGLPATVTQRLISHAGNGWDPASVDDPVIIAEMPDAQERYGPRAEQFHVLQHELNAEEEETLQGYRVLEQVNVVLTQIEQRVWEQRGIDILSWQSDMIMEWLRIREEQGATALTRHELALLIRVTELARKREILMQFQSQMPYLNLVAIDGGLGVGKSTLISHLQEHFGVPQVREDVTLSRWVAPSIGGSQREKQLSAELAQLYYRVSKLDEMADTIIRILSIRALGGSVSQTIVVDRSISPGDEQFIDMHVEAGNIVDRSRLDRLYNLFAPLLPQEQYFVVLTASAHELDARQRSRGRVFERGLPLEFLGMMQARTQRGVMALTLPPHSLPNFAVAVIDTEQVDEDEVLTLFLNQIRIWQLHLPERIYRI